MKPEDRPINIGGAFRCCIGVVREATRSGAIPENIHAGYAIKCNCGDGMTWNGHMWVANWIYNTPSVNQRVTYEAMHEKEKGKS